MSRSTVTSRAAAENSTVRKLWSLLTPQQHHAAILLLTLMLVGMVLEILGLGLVIPALAIMTRNDLVVRYPGLAPWLHRLGDPSQEQLAVYGMLALVAVSTFKAGFLALLAWRQARFTCALQSVLSQRLFAGYLRQPYTFHLERNSAQLIRIVIGEVDDIGGVIQQAFALGTEALMLVGVSALLLTVEPIGAVLVVGTLGLAGWAQHRLTNRHLLRWGVERQLHEPLRVQHLQQALGGVKDIKMLGREADFLAQYDIHNRGSRSAGERQFTVMALPRLWLELLAVVGLAGLVLVMVLRGKPLEALLPTLGLFAAAAFRLIPSANRAVMAVQSLRFWSPVINSLRSELDVLDGARETSARQPLPFRDALSLDRVTFSYASADGPALQDVSLNIPRGSAIGFVGTTGAGKTTLVDIILGLLTPDSGEVTVDAVDIRTNVRGWQDQIGYVSQSIFLTDDTLRRNVAFGLAGDQIDEAAVWRAIGAAQLEKFVNTLPLGLDTIIGERGVRLSGGQRQRIGIARALYHDPAVLVLDEATSSLDTATEREVMSAVRALRGDKTILIVAHRLSTVEHCDRLFRLEQGHVVEEGETAVVLGRVAGYTTN